MHKTSICRNYKEIEYFWWHSVRRMIIVDIAVVAVFKFYFVVIFLI